MKIRSGFSAQSLLHAHFPIICFDNLKAQMANNRGEELATIGVIFDDENFIGHGKLFKQSLCQQDVFLSNCNFCKYRGDVVRWRAQVS